MKKILTLVGVITILCKCSFGEEEKKDSTIVPTINIETFGEQPIKILHLSGEIIEILTPENPITVKKEDGSIVVLKALIPKTHEILKELKIGDKVNIIYGETKEEKVIIRIRKIGERDRIEGSRRKLEEGRKKLGIIKKGG